MAANLAACLPQRSKQPRGLGVIARMVVDVRVPGRIVVAVVNREKDNKKWTNNIPVKKIQFLLLLILVGIAYALSILFKTNYTHAIYFILGVLFGMVGGQYIKKEP